jgi:ATP-binding cassette subfamily B protein RaxB
MSIIGHIDALEFGARRLPVILQGEAAECGLACLAMVAAWHDCDISLLTLRQRFSFSLRGATLKQLVEIAGALQMSARPVKVELEDLAHLRMPCVLHWNLNHFVVLKRVRTAADGKLVAVELHDPARGALRVAPAELGASFTGVALELVPAAGFTPRVEKQSLRLSELVTRAVGLRGALAQLFGLALALEFVALLAPLFLQTVVDGPLASGDLGMVAVLALGFGLLVLIQAGIGAARSWTVLYLGNHLNLQWVANVFAHLLNLPLSYFEKRHLGDIHSRFNAIHAIRETLSGKFVEAVLDSLMSLVALAVLLLYSPALAAVAAAALAAYLGLRSALHRALRVATEEQLVFKASEQSVFLESIRGIQAIKLANHEQARHARWLNAVGASINRNIRTEKLNLLFRTATSLLTGVENIVVIWLGARLVAAGDFSLGMLYAFLAYKQTFTARAYALVDKMQDLRMLSLQGERLADIVLSPREEATLAAGEAPVPDELSIELRDVWYRYSDADPWVLRGVNLSIAPNQSVAVTGASGCGKSTLLKLLIGILAPTRGEILVGGVPLASFGTRRYRAHIGAVMQDDQLFAGSVLENISFFDDMADLDWIAQCAHAACIAGDLDAMPMGYQTLIGDMGTSLSGGQKQRLLLARALYRRPRILFLDEATSHLDSDNERGVNEAIAALSLTRVLVAHRKETIATVQRVVELSNGVVVRDAMQGARGNTYAPIHEHREVTA